MAYVGFSDCGYEYFNLGHYLLFSEDCSHELLFRYVQQDLSCLPALFGQYIFERMDTSTFEVRDRLCDNSTLDEIKKGLAAAHPYYKHEAGNILLTEIGRYFNNLLIYSICNLRKANPNFSEEWYIKRITNLMEPLLKLGDSYPTDFYHQYQKWTNKDGYTAGYDSAEIETFIENVPREMPIGLIDEIRTQRSISNMLYFLLDISAQGLDDLTTPQRVWLYSNIIAYGDTGVSVSKKLSLKHPILFRANHEYSQSMEHCCELNDKFSSLHTLDKMNIAHDGVPDGMGELLHSAVDYTKTVPISKNYEEYKINSLYQLLYLEILSMVQDEVMVRKCKRCGKYFVVTNRRTAYCDRVDASGIRCSAVGPQQSFQKKLEEDEPLRAYNRAYKTHHARVQKGIMSKDDFQLWYSEAKQQLAKTRAGELELGRFQEWLKK